MSSTCPLLTLDTLVFIKPVLPKGREVSVSDVWASLSTTQHLPSPDASSLLLSKRPAIPKPRTASSWHCLGHGRLLASEFYSLRPDCPEEEGLISQGVSRQHKDSVSVSGAHRGLSLSGTHKTLLVTMALQSGIYRPPGRAPLCYHQQSPSARAAWFLPP